MTILERIKDECKKKKNISITTLEVQLGYSNGSLAKAKDIPSSRILEISKYLDVPMEYLMTGENISSNKSSLTSRDEKDIKTILSNTEELLKQPGLMFEGKPVSQESVDSILSAMQIGMEMAKKRNKELYTPKKYKEE